MSINSEQLLADKLSKFKETTFIVTNYSKNMNGDLLKIRTNCPICLSFEKEELLNFPMTNSKIINFHKLEMFYSDSFRDEYFSNISSNFCFKVVKCNECKFYYNEHILNNIGMDMLYNSWLDQKKLVDYYGGKTFDINEKFRLIFLQKYFKNRSKINILDFGAGFGNFLKLAKSPKTSLYAYDLSNEKNDYMENNLGVTLVRNLKKHEYFFHFINLNQVLEHVSNPLELLKELKNCLTEDGIIFISTPNSKGIEKLLREENFNKELWNKLSPFQHINGFKNYTLKLISKNAGLSPYNFLKSIKIISFSMFGVLFYLKQIYHYYLGTSLYCRRNQTDKE